MPIIWKLAIWGMLLCVGLVACLGSASVWAFENELDEATIVSFQKHVRQHHYACDTVRFSHILFEDELVLVVDLFCDDGAGFEIVNLPHRNITFVERLDNAAERNFGQEPDKEEWAPPVDGSMTRLLRAESD